jgi:hypothetical protein
VGNAWVPATKIRATANNLILLGTVGSRWELRLFCWEPGKKRKTILAFYDVDV